jgi:hypothetical protein
MKNIQTEQFVKIVIDWVLIKDMLLKRHVERTEIQSVNFFISFV